MEITIPQLEQLYADHKYTVTEVVRWYMARIEKYNGIYRAVQNLDLPGALATAAREDAEAKAGGAGFVRGPLWGVPIVTKANTSVKGLITTDGWKGYMIPGHELIAPKDATIVAKASRGRSGHHRADQHAGFCGERYQSQHRLRAHRKCLRRALQSRWFFGRHRHRRHLEFCGAWQRNRYRQLDPDAGCHELCGRRVSQRAAW